MMHTILIADDEPHSRRYMKELLAKEKTVELIGECGNGNEVLAFCKNQVPDILFLDIKMPRVDGIEVAKSLKGSKCRIVFSTAYDQYAIQAFETEALDYLLKPYSEKRFFEVLNRAKTESANQKRIQFSDRIERLFSHYHKGESPKISSFTIKEKGFETQVEINQILYLKANSVYVTLVTAKKNYLYRTSLELVSRQLPSEFKRIHRSIIINREYIEAHKYLNNNTFSFRMQNDETLISSRSFKSQIREWLRKGTS